jgi:hypothetical protein
MAQVPMNPAAPQVQQSAQPTPFEHVQVPPGVGAGLGEGLGQLGGAAQHTSEALEAHAVQFQQLNNQQAADAASTQANSHIDSSVRDYLQANPGMAAQANLLTFYKQLETDRAKFGEQLPLPAQVEFNANTRRWMGSALATVSSRAAEMRRQSIDGTAKAATQQAIDKAAGDPTYNPLPDIGKQAQVLQTLHGWSDEQAHGYMRDNISQVYFGQVKRAIDGGDYDAARKVIADHGSDMTQRDLDNAMGPLRTLHHANQVSSLASAFLTGGTIGAGSRDATLDDIARLENSGPSAVSPKGATGTYQIMPDTARQYGLDPTRLKDPEYNKYAAGVILDDIHKRFPGDGAAQTIAWNGGPGRASQWIQSGRDNSTLPAETAGYVGRSGFQTSHEFAGFGPVTNNMDVPTYLGKVETAAFDYAQHNIPDAANRDQFIQEVRKQAQLATSGVLNTQQGTYNSLAKLVESGNIRSVTDFQQAHAGEWNSLPAKYQGALESKLKWEANMMTPDKQAALETLDAARLTNPNAFMSADIRSQNLPFAQERRLLEQQDAMRQSVASGKALDTFMVKALRDPLVTTPLKGIGLSASTDPAGYQQFVGALGAEMEAYRDGPGKGNLPQGKDLSGIVAKLVAQKGGGFLGWGAHPGYQAAGVPDDQQTAIRAQFRQLRGRDPTVDEIGSIYSARPNQ